MYRKLTLVAILTVLSALLSTDMLIASEVETETEKLVTTIYQAKHMKAVGLFSILKELRLLKFEKGETSSFTRHSKGTLFLRLRGEERVKEVLSFLKKADVPKTLTKKEKLEDTNVRVRVRIILGQKKSKQEGQALKAEIAKALSQIFGHETFSDLGSNYINARVNRKSSIEFFTKTDLNLELVYKVDAREDGRYNMDISINSDYPYKKDDGSIHLAKGKLNTVIIAEPGKEFILGNTQVGGGRALIYAITVDKDK